MVTNCIDAGSRLYVDAESVPPCFQFGMSANYGHTVVLSDYVGEEQDGACAEGYVNSWNLSVGQFTGAIVFDGCQPMPADGMSTINASLTSTSTLTAPISWSIDSPDLGASIIYQDDGMATIRAGTTNGTITVRACGDGCCITANLDLVAEDSDPDSCGTCGDGEDDTRRFIFGRGQSFLNDVDLRMSLGNSSAANSAGLLQVLANYPTNLSYSPKDLMYSFKRDDVHVIRDANGDIRQVRAPQGLADVVVSNETAYAVNFYIGTNVGIQKGWLYLTNSSPYNKWIIENPDPATTNRLKITESPSGESQVVYEYTWLTNGWQLDSASGLRVQTKNSAWTTNAGTVYRTDTLAVRQGTNAILAQRSRKYEVRSTNEVLLEEISGTGSTARTNTYSYYSDNLLQQKTRADGSWEHYLYDNRKRPTNIFSAFGTQGPTTNKNLCKLIEHDYSTNAVSGSGDNGLLSPGSPRLITEYLLGQTSGRRFQVFLPGETRDIVCLSTNASYTDASNLVTVTTTYTNGYFFGDTKSVLRPDGTMEFFYYDHASDGHTTNTVVSGQPNSERTAILDGTTNITVTGPVAQLISRKAIDVVSGILTVSETYTNFDDFARARKVTYLDGTSTRKEFASCCGEQSVTNREGTVTTYAYDALKRLLTTKVNSITHSNVYDAAGNVTILKRIGSDSSVTTLAQNSYDTAGNLTQTIDALSQYRTFTESNDASGQLIKVSRVLTNGSSGPPRVEIYFRDGSLNTVTGSLVHPVRSEYGPTNNGHYMKEIKLGTNLADTAEWTMQLFDLAGRQYKTLYPDGAASFTYYNTNGQAARVVDPDGVTTLYQYNAKGEVEYTASDLNRDSAIDFGGTDRITQTVSLVTTDNGFNVRQTKTYTWATNNSSVSNLVAMLEISTDELRTWNKSFGLTNKSQTYFAGSGNRYVTNTAPDGSWVINFFQNDQLKTVTWKNSAGTQLSQTTYAYDAHGRQTTATDARNGTTSYGYDNLDRVTSMTTPAPGTGQSPQTSSYSFDALGRTTRTTLPDGASVTNEYFDSGELKKTYGARTYPVEYSFDYGGRLETLKTWKDYSGGSGAATTTWGYNGRGFLTNKVYEGGSGSITYTNTAAGRLRSRTWARGITTTYSTNAIGEVVGMTYSDGKTPNVTFNLDRLGRATNIIDGTGTNLLSYHQSGLLVLEDHASSLLSGMSLSNSYDGYLRRSQLVFKTNNGTSAFTNSYTYDGASRLTNVTNGFYSASYSYLANSPLVSQITFRSNTVTRMITTKQYDLLNRLSSISSTSSSASSISFAYTHNDANQRIRSTLADSSYWIYEYDNLGHVKSGKRYWSDGTPVAGQQFEYAFDDIGNRNSTKAGGDAVGAGLRPASYTNNTLNQITGRDVPGAVDIIGAATATATNVNVNNQLAYRRGEYYQVALSINNASAPQWQSVTNRAVQAGTTNTVTGNVFLPKSPELFSHDADGNLTNDGHWAYVWDAENRLLSMTAPSALPTGARLALSFDYDWQGRRISKIVSNWTDSAWTRVLHEKYLYDGWNLAAILNGTNNALMKSFLWGLDLSGTIQGAGGVGGLLAANDAANGVFFAAYDGNGNVVALVKATDGTVSASYEYGPFAEPIRITGTMGKTNPFRFSTKFQDDESDAYYYGYRYYNASTGRWLSRDPLGERGGKNLYAFVENNPANGIDPLGRESMPWYIFKQCLDVFCSPSLFTMQSHANAAQQAGMKAANAEYGDPNSLNHRGMRHCVASGVLATTEGCSGAECIGTAREDWQTKERRQTEREGNRGKNNNKLGRGCAGCTGDNAQSNPEGGLKPKKSLQDIIKCCKDAIDKGKADTGE